MLWCLSKTCGAPTKFAATLGNATGRYGDLSQIDEWGAGIVTFESGAVGIIEAGWVDAKNTSPIEVHGTEGEILVRGGEVFYFSNKVEGADGRAWTDLPPSDDHAFELFWDKLAGKDVPLVSVEEAALESAVMGELYAAA